MATYKIEYTLGWRYALRLDRDLFKDILHDAYLHWFDKKGKNLFEEHNGTICRVIKLTYYGYYINSRIRGRHFEEFDNHSFTTLTPEQQLIEAQALELTTVRIKEIGEQIKAHFPKTADNMIKALNMKFEGYEQQEIAQTLNVSKPTITYYMNNIRSQLNRH